MTKLEKLFQEAVCTETAAVGQLVSCGCGEIHTSDEGDQVRYGEFAGLRIVLGCECESASSFGNMLWQNRHSAARFLRGMSHALEVDRAALICVLPPAAATEPETAGEFGGGERA